MLALYLEFFGIDNFYCRIPCGPTFLVAEVRGVDAGRPAPGVVASASAGHRGGGVRGDAAAVDGRRRGNSVEFPGKFHDF